jgi:hypothetical protein
LKKFCTSKLKGSHNFFGAKFFIRAFLF